MTPFRSQIWSGLGSVMGDRKVVTLEPENLKNQHLIKICNCYDCLLRGGFNPRIGGSLVTSLFPRGASVTLAPRCRK
jgi:hypothetical protein